MKSALTLIKPAVGDQRKQPEAGGEPEGTPWAFYLFMALLAVALIYFLILPFMI